MALTDSGFFKTTDRHLLRMMMENIPDRIYFKDAESRFLSVSRSLAEFYRLDSSATLIGKTDFDFFTREHAQPAFDDERQIMATGKPIIGKVEKETLLDGRVHWAITTKMPLQEEDGKIIGTFGITKDITDLIGMKQALDDERNLLRRLIDSLPDHIYVKDMQSRFRLCNEAVATFLKLPSADRIFGKTDYDFFPADAANVYREEERGVFDGKPSINREYEILGQDGHSKFMMTTKVPLKDPNGTIVGLVGINRDTTELKKANDRLLAVNASLERALTQLKKSHEELEAAQAQLIDGEKLQLTGRLAAGIAHEVKNPLAIIGMGMECLKQTIGETDPAINTIVKDIDEAIQRANSVIGGLLDFARPRALDLKPNDLNAVIEQSLVFVKHEITKKHIRVEKNLGPNLPLLRLDSNKMKQVFVNLFLNAIHAMPDKGHLTVGTFKMPAPEFVTQLKGPTRESIRFRTAQKTGTTVMLGKSAKSGESVRITNVFRNSGMAVVCRIEDNGTGIPEQNLKSIFEPFFTTKLGGQGHGLGLPVTKQIVDLHGGLIELINRALGGVCATVAFLAEGGKL